MKGKSFNDVMDYLKEVQGGYKKAFEECDEKNEEQKAYYKGRSDGMNYCIYVICAQINSDDDI